MVSRGGRTPFVVESGNMPGWTGRRSILSQLEMFAFHFAPIGWATTITVMNYLFLLPPARKRLTLAGTLWRILFLLVLALLLLAAEAVKA